ncbi:MAG: glycosyltransferase family 2 protein [Candidatus Yanofskybacteria bacterium]|nr:glycosyltransferase family 2 protein [Candidatus Yanofskybacteria bacterium]
MNLTIVTVNYNSSENTIKLLESLKNQTDKNFDVLVIDNNSGPDQKAALKNYRTEETNIVFIENDRNLGYSGGNNVGIKKAIASGSDWMLLLNNDTWVKNDFISRLKANLEGKEGVMGLAVDEDNPEKSQNNLGTSRTVYAGKIEWLKPTLIHITTFKVVIKPVDNMLTNDLQGRYYAIGGAVAIHKDVFDKIGFLDEKYFLYFEDADFSMRTRKARIPIEFMSEIKVLHSVSASTKKLGSPMLMRYHYRNALYFNRKNGPWYIKLLVWPWSWIVAAKQILKMAVGRNREQSKAILAGVMDFYKNNYGKLHV